MAWSDPFLNMLVGRPHNKWHFLEESLTIKCLNILLEYNCLSVLYWFLLNAKSTGCLYTGAPALPGLPSSPIRPISPSHHGALS